MKLDHTLLTQITANSSTLTSIDLSYQNLQLTEVKALAQACQTNTNLKKLSVAGNLLGDAAAQLLGQITNLTTLNISANKITAAGIQNFSKHPSLIELDVSYNNIGTEGAAELASNPLLEKLDLRGNKITAIGAQTFRNNKTLRSLIAADNDINAAGAIALTNLPNLIHLSLCNNYISDEGAIALATNCPALIYLDVSYNEIGTRGAHALAASRTIEHLLLAYNRCGVEGAAAFAQNKKLLSLNLAGNMIDNEGIKSIIRGNTTLQSLDASYNHINDDAIQDVKEFATHPNLTQLDLSFNQITFASDYPLTKNARLRWLALAYNLIANQGATAIAQMPGLSYLDLSANHINSAGAEALAKNTTITTLKLSHNYLGDKGASVLAQNTTIVELVLPYTQISDPGALELAKNKTIKLLCLNFNPIGEAGIKALTTNKGITYPAAIKDTPFTEITADYKNIADLLSHDLICICNPDGVIVFFNSAFTRVFHYCAEELLGKHLIDLFHPEDREMGYKRLAESAQKPITCEIRCLNKKGTLRTLRLSSQAKHGHFYIIGADITEQKKLDIVLRREEERQLELRLQTMRDFISHLCHEIRNPLNGTIGLTEVLKEQVQQMQVALLEGEQTISSAIKQRLASSQKEITQALHEMQACLSHASSILDNNLDLSKLAEGKVTIEKKVLSIKKVIQDALAMLAASPSLKNLALTLELPTSDIIITGDINKLKQIVLNLISNAIKFTEKGSIIVKLKTQAIAASQLHCQLEVSDTGVGLDESALTQIFDRFSTLSHKASYGAIYSGSGLGLSLTKKLVELMGGKITVESKKGAGTTFRCDFNFAIPTEQEIKVATAISKFTSPVLPQEFLKGKKVLIAEDNSINLKLLESYLKKAAAEVLLATDGAQAVTQYKNHHQTINVVLMDIIMDNMDGLQAAREIRQFESTAQLPKVPIIAVTGQALEEDKQKAFAAGMNSYITKPYKKDEIYRALYDIILTQEKTPKQTEAVVVAPTTM